jgi:O-antigen biosynthesis protein
MLFVRDFMTDQTVLRASDAPERPLVSVVLPTFCRGKNGMLERAIASVLAQTMADFELLVLDDGSADGSYELIEAIRLRDPRVVHVRHERNSGIPSLRVNEGIVLSRGQYLAFQFDDDYWHPHALQALTAEASRHADPVVVVGKAHLQGQAEPTLPAADINLSTLYEQNRFANNAVLIPRQVVDRFGMYDCHIGMRRMCDWDLWLRYIKHLPFLVVDELISEVFIKNGGSIGLTVPWDLSLFRYLHDIPRDHLLTPMRWLDYEIDALRVGEVQIEADIRRRLYEEQIVPYYARFRHHFPVVEGFPATLPPARKTVLLTKRWYDCPIDVGLQPYDAQANRRGTYKAYLQPDSQVGPGWTQEADGLLLVRTIEDEAKLLMQQALDSNIPVGFYLDDDLLNFHEYGPQFNYLAPGTPAHRNLTEMVSRADTFWATTEYLKDLVQPLNPRTIPHNGAVSAQWLPETLCSRPPGRVLRIGYVGSGYRIDEFRLLWDALRAVSAEYTDRLCFEFWGLDTSALPPLASPVKYRPFTHSYPYYLRQLHDAEFDILLSPLLEHPRPRMAKSIPKYYESAVAGALSIYSDVPQYRKLPAGLTCLKAANTAQAWHDSLSKAITMPGPQFDRMRRRALEHVREEYTELAQINLHEAAWRATEFHAKTRALRHADGRPRIVYVFHSAHLGGGEMGLWRQVLLTRQYGIAPIVVLPRADQHGPFSHQLRNTPDLKDIQVEFAEYSCFDVPKHPGQFRSESQRSEVQALLERCAPALVHSVTFIPTFGQICEEMNIPHVASLYQVEDAFSWVGPLPQFTHCAVVQSDSARYASRWSELLGAEKVCARQLVPVEVFSLGQRCALESLGDLPERRTRSKMIMVGTFQQRKSQWEAIEAFGQLIRQGRDCLLDFYGYTHFYPEYVERCRQLVRKLNLNDRITFHDFEADMLSVLEPADIVLSLSTNESLPTIIKEAMAAGVLVVATPVGGISEVIVDGVSGILCADTSLAALVEGMQRALDLPPLERARITHQARRVARSEFHPHRAANDLMLTYNRAIDLTQQHDAATGRSQTRPIPGQADFHAELPERPPLPPVGHLHVGRGLSYRLLPQRDHWSGLSLLVGTNQRRADGNLTLRIWTTRAQLLRECTAKLESAVDNTWVEFQFPAIVNAADIPFVVEFRVAASSAQTVISLYETAQPDPLLQRLLRRAGIQRTRSWLYCSLHHDG